MAIVLPTATPGRKRRGAAGLAVAAEERALTPASLDPRPQRTKRLAASRGWLEGFQRGHGDEDLVWIAILPIIVRTEARFHLCTAPRRAASERRAKAFVDAYGSGADRGWALFDGHLFQPTTENQRRAQYPIATELGEEHPPPRSVVPRASRADELERRAIALAGGLTAQAARKRLRLPKRDFLYRQFIAAAANLVWYEAVIEAARPQASVIGSTHSFQGRALALASRRAGVPCVHVPHAPVVADARIVDLPVDFVAARGPKERDHYEAFGADGSAITVIGNPALDALPAMPRIDPRKPPVFAMTHHETEIFEGAVALVRETLGSRVAASPHPRSDPKLIPAEWEAWPGRTSELLQTGPPAVIQCSSGSGLEALQLGIPTIELTFAGEEPNYPFLGHPGVPAVSTSTQLRAAVEEAARATASDREELRTWAEGWVSAAGADAAEAGAALVRRAAREGPRAAPVWDAWGAGPRGRLRGLFDRLRATSGA